jgi:oligopeptide transport system ATP-binding protein
VPLLNVQDLRTHFHTRNGVYRAVDGVSFSVERGETLGIVGESGSGKSVTCYSIMGLIPQPPGRIVSGTAFFDGIDLLHCSPRQARSIRGKRVSMIFQDPMTSLNPFLRVSEQIIEPLLIHENISRRDALARALTMLEAVGINDAAKRIHYYPHEFSGGMRQRVMIAMALITKPELLIADEPTTALDVTVQAQILELIGKMQRELGMAVIFITHDLGVVSGLCDRVQVMYAGRIVETADTRTSSKNRATPTRAPSNARFPPSNPKVPNSTRSPACRPMFPKTSPAAPSRRVVNSRRIAAPPPIPNCSSSMPPMRKPAFASKPAKP